IGIRAFSSVVNVCCCLFFLNEKIFKVQESKKILDSFYLLYFLFELVIVNIWGERKQMEKGGDKWEKCGKLEKRENKWGANVVKREGKISCKNFYLRKKMNEKNVRNKKKVLQRKIKLKKMTIRKKRKKKKREKKRKEKKTSSVELDLFEREKKMLLS
ncbi:hypothetical protein RFI_39365, partial [Reticulomyxa filosa]